MSRALWLVVGLIFVTAGVALTDFRAVPLFDSTLLWAGPESPAESREARSKVVAMAADNQGHLFVVSTLDRDTFAVPARAFQRVRKGKRDVVIAKFDRSLTRLLAATYVGGSENDEGRGVAVDRRGDVYIVGVTESADFPVTPGVLGPSYRGKGDVFVAVLDGNLHAVRRATFLGGAREEGLRSPLRFLLAGSDILVAGTTASPDFPVTAGAFSTTHKGGNDVFVVRLDGALARVKAATLLGGADSESVGGLAISAGGGPYIAGWTTSGDFPFTAQGMLSKGGGRPRAYVARLDGELRTLQAAAGIDTPRHIFLYAIALDAEDNVYITGHAHAGFPTTPGAFRERLDGWPDGGYVARLTPDLTRIAAATFTHGGGKGADGGNASGWDVVIDRRGRVVVTGLVERQDFPVTRGAYDEFHAGDTDAFIAVFDRELRRIEAATLLGGGGFEKAVSVIAAPDGSLYCAGVTGSADFPVSARAYGRTFEQGHSCFITRFGADLTAPAQSPLAVALAKDDLPAVRRLAVRRPALVTRSNASGISPLHLAARSGLREASRLLVEHGAAVHVADKTGNTPLHWAAVYNQADLAEWLIGRGAQPDRANRTGHTPLHLAAGHGGGAAAATLLRRGANLEVRNQDGDTPLHLATSYHHAGMVRQLLQAGAAVNARNARGQTPLHLGVRPMDNQEVCGLLLDAGADKNALDGDHRTALHDAIWSWGNCDSLLLEKGADPNIGDKEGRTLLHHAVARGNAAKGLVERLLARGADPHRTDHAGKSPLVLAKEKNFDQLVTLIEKR